MMKLKSRFSATRFDFQLHVHTLQPWPSGNKAIAVRRALGGTGRPPRARGGQPSAGAAGAIQAAWWRGRPPPPRVGAAGAAD